MHLIVLLTPVKRVKMGACVEKIICLGTFCACETINLPIQTSEPVLYMKSDFNGTFLTKQITDIAGNTIQLPNVFNEAYENIVRFYKTDGTLLNGVAYSFKTMPCFNLDGEVNNPDMYSSIVFTASAAGAAVNDSRMIGMIVTGVMINDYSKNTGFTKPINSDTITFSDGTVVNNGDTITVIFE